MKRYKVVVIDTSMDSNEPETYFLEYQDLRSIIMLITEEQEIVKIELVGEIDERHWYYETIRKEKGNIPYIL